MTTTTSLSRLALAAVLSSAALFSNLPAQAEEKAAPPKAEVPPPPRPGNLDEPIEPTITIRKEGGNTIEEYRIGGQLYMMKVTPQGAPPYYLVDPNGKGAFSRLDSPNPPTAVPQWVIFKF